MSKEEKKKSYKALVIERLTKKFASTSSLRVFQAVFENILDERKFFTSKTVLDKDALKELKSIVGEKGMEDIYFLLGNFRKSDEYFDDEKGFLTTSSQSVIDETPPFSDLIASEQYAKIVDYARVKVFEAVGVKEEMILGDFSAKEKNISKLKARSYAVEKVRGLVGYIQTQMNKKEKKKSGFLS